MVVRAEFRFGAVPADNTGLTAWNGSVRNPNAPPLQPSNPPQTTAVQQQNEPTGAPMHGQSSSVTPTKSGGLLPLPTKTSKSTTTTTPTS